MKKEVLQIQSKIFTVRGLQVMLDSNLAKLYQVETFNLNKAVKRNIKRFPKDFMFQLTSEEYNSLTFHSGISKGKGGRRFLPYVFTEQGVATLSGVLKSKIAIGMNIQIMRAFVTMRKFLLSNAQIFHRLDRVEFKQIEYDQKLEQVFKAIEDKSLTPSKKIFFDGQIFDAYQFVSNLIRKAKKSIILVDNYVDESILTLFSKTKTKVTIYTKLTKQLRLDLKKYDSQHDNIEIKEFSKSHDRFLIVDNVVYHVGASLKDLGKKWFAFSRFEDDFGIIEKLNNVK